MQRLLPTVLDRTSARAESVLDTGKMLANAREASEFLKALSHESRLVILCLLIERERTVSELEQLLDLRQSSVAQQLARLRADDLVQAKRDGKNIYYSIARPEVVEIIGSLYRTFCKR
jgi:DNA-binding transcriptional ArsR family regulator